jgi:predicted nucleotide-binding protein
VSLNVSWGLLRSEGENAYILTSEGEGRLQQVLRELPSLGAKSAQAEPSPSAVASQTTASPGISRRTAVVLGEVLNEAFTIRAPDPEDPLELVRQVQGELLYDFLIEREYDESFCNRMRALQGERAVKDAIIQIHTGSFWSDNGRKDSGRKTLGQQLLWKLARDILRDPKQQRLYYKAGYTEPLLQSLKQDGFVFADGELIPQPQDDLHSFGNDSSEVQDNPPATKVEPGARSIDPLGEGSMAGMTEDAKDIVRWLREQYLVAGFPDHHGWKFSPAKSNRTAIAELRAHGLIEVFGTGGRNWTLTDVGQRLLLRMGADAANGTMPQAETEGKDMQPDPQKVFVIHGRNLNARKELGTFLRSLGLTPLNFGDLRGKMGGTPTVAEIVERGMAEAQGIVALFTAEEYSAVKPDYRYAHDKPDDIIRWQSRPNVIFEAGMAFGKDKKRVVFVLLGSPILFSDVAGIHGLRPDNKPEGDRSVLRQTLKSMGCRIEEDSSDWMTSGDLEGCIESLQGVGTRDPFG